MELIHVWFTVRSIFVVYLSGKKSECFTIALFKGKNAPKAVHADITQNTVVTVPLHCKTTVITVVCSRETEYAIA